MVRPLGFYECERMPFGLTNTPATFQHLIQSCLCNLHLQYKTPEEHLTRLQPVFENFKEG